MLTGTRFVSPKVDGEIEKGYETWGGPFSSAPNLYMLRSKNGKMAGNQIGIGFGRWQN